MSCLVQKNETWENILSFQKKAPQCPSAIVFPLRHLVLASPHHSGRTCPDPTTPDPALESQWTD